jgi:hypothetical protein
MILLRVVGDLRPPIPRDKVFALVGFIAAWEEAPLVIDYTLPVLQVYAQVAKHIAGEYYSLAFLCDCIYGDSDPRHNLPTWVPDYSKLPSVDLFAYTAESTPVDHCFVTSPRFLRRQSITLYRRYSSRFSSHSLSATRIPGDFARSSSPRSFRSIPRLDKDSTRTSKSGWNPITLPDRNDRRAYAS